MKKLILYFTFFLLICLTLPPPVTAQIVNIPDANLRAAIETALGQASGVPITASEMKILRHLEARNTNIDDLTGLEFAINLTELDLGYVKAEGRRMNSNSVSNLSSLAGSTSLTELRLWGNSISDVSALAELTNLTLLDISDNSISDISPLAGLINLTHLDLDNNALSDISAVAGLTNLTFLDIWGTPLSDISPVVGLTNLTALGLGGNNISNISPVAGLTNLTGLYLLGNHITDISSLSDLTNLKTLWLQNNNISDISPLVANTGLGRGDEVYVQGNPLSYASIKTHIPDLKSRGITVEFDDVSVKVVEPVNIPDPNLRAAIMTTLNKAPGATLTTWDMATLTRLEAQDANISNLTGLEHATNLTRLDLGYNYISDLSPLTGLTRLPWLNLTSNNIRDISPLVENTGLGNDDEINVQGNPLSHISIKTHIPILQSRGVTVKFDDTTHLNVGEPRTVRLIYFLPNDRSYRADVVQRMKDEILNIQTFFAEMMEAHSWGKTFRVETKTQGEPKVHRMDGKHPDTHYLDNTYSTVYDEVERAFDLNANVYCIVIDNSIDGIGLDAYRRTGGVGGRRGKNGGLALVSDEFRVTTVVHELGHAFGLHHNFNDDAYIMSHFSPERNQLSACGAEYLSIHPYFNPNTSTKKGERPTIELISPPRYTAGARSIPVRLKISDSKGLYQMRLLVRHSTTGNEMKACRGLAGDKDTVVEFDYDGVIPSDGLTSLSNPVVHPMYAEVVDTDGNAGWTFFVLFSEALQPLMKISGDNLHSLPNTLLPVPFVVELRDVNNGFVRDGVPVTFTVIAGDGMLSVTRTTTDEKGRSESTLTLGPNLGINTVEVSAAGIEGTVIFNAVAGAAVDIPDTNLRAAVEEALGKAPGTPIAPAEMAILTRLEARNANISDLTGLEHATNLEVVLLQRNNILDISPVVGLTHLTVLGLGGNSVSDISAVAGLTNLKVLRLWINSISDISALSSLSYLRELALEHNNITDLSPLVANTRLENGDTVDVRGNPLSYQSIHTHIPALKSRGVTIEFDMDGTRPPDVNNDGSVNVLDLILIASKFENTGANLAADVNGDGVVNVIDLVLVAGMLNSAAAPSAAQPQVPETLTAVEIHGWLTGARTLEVRDPIMKRGFLVLEQLLLSLTPKETELLANYPNPFNPETWIPYRLAEDAFVTLTIYDGSGQIIRALEVGHRIASAYENRSKAIYWDGRNDVRERVASGVYFYTLSADEYSATRRMLIIK